MKAFHLRVKCVCKFSNLSINLKSVTQITQIHTYVCTTFTSLNFFHT